MTSMTKAQLLDENIKLRHNCDLLERKVAELESALGETAGLGQSQGPTPAAHAARNPDVWFDKDLRAQYRVYCETLKAKAAAGGFVVKAKSYAQWLGALQ